MNTRWEGNPQSGHGLPKKRKKCGGSLRIEVRETGGETAKISHTREMQVPQFHRKMP